MSQPEGREARALAAELVFIEESYIGRESRGPYYFMCSPICIHHLLPYASYPYSTGPHLFVRSLTQPLP